MNNKEQGYVSVLAMLIAGAVCILVLAQSVSRSAETIESTLLMERSLVANTIAHTCLERVIQQVRTDVLYEGDEQLVIGDGKCDVSPIDTSVQTDVRVNVVSTFDSIEYNVSVEFDVTDTTVETVTWIR